MNRFSRFASTAIVTGLAVGPALGQPVNLDGSVGPHAAKKPTLATTAASSLERANVPSAKDTPVDVKAAADADMQNRDKRPRLKAERENLKGDDAKRALAQQSKPSTYDRDIQTGDIDHTEQVTNLKITIKK